MKSAIYIEDGLMQIIITPESDFEKSCLNQFRDGGVDSKIFYGQFYDCRGGWVRQRDVLTGPNEVSLILAHRKNDVPQP